MITVFERLADELRGLGPDPDTINYKRIEMYDALEKIRKDGLLDEILDTGYYNDSIRGYLKIAMFRAGVPEETQKKVMEKLYFVFDDYNARKAYTADKFGIPQSEYRRREAAHAD